jgi:hypothetical protein
MQQDKRDRLQNAGHHLRDTVDLADFEGLIRQALARQDATDPAVREHVYKASRNAFARMIATAGPQNPQTIQMQRDALENCISRIEASYARHTPQTATMKSSFPSASDDPGRRDAAYSNGHRSKVDTQSRRPHQESRQTQRATESAAGDQQANPVPGAQSPVGPSFRGPPYSGSGDPGTDDENELFLEESARTTFPIEGGGLRRPLAFFAVFCLLLVVAWLIYSLVDTLSPGETSEPATAESNAPSEPASSVEGPESSSYITILSPSDTGALQTAGGGNAQIVNQSNLEFIRLTSVRSPQALSESADPILVEIKPGVMQEIAGKHVTLEILAKSGETGPATFSIFCVFDGVEACGRKRFRLGLQPEAIVFALDVPDAAGGGGNTHFALNTDITSSASITGQGDVVDILYARLRLPGN